MQSSILTNGIILFGVIVFLTLTPYSKANCQYAHDYKTLYCYEVTEDEFQSFIETIYGDVVRLELVKSNVSKLTRQMFSSIHMKSIERMYLYGDDIQYLEEDVFDGMPNFTDIEINDNSQTWNISTGIFRGANITRMVYMNSKLNYIQPGSFYNARNLESLLIIDSQLTHLSLGTFAGSSLTYIMLIGNNLTYIAPGAFLGLDSIWSIDLSLNNIQSLADDTFDGMPNLYYLTLAANNLTVLNYVAFRGLDRLEVLNLSSNGISEVDWTELRKYMPNLQKVILSDDRAHCDFDETEKQLFCSRVTENQIISHASKLSASVDSLYIIDSKINKLTKNIFNIDQLQNIHTLYLRNSHINELEQGICNGCRNLRKFEVHNNLSPWNISIDTFKGTNNLESIILIDSRLTDINPGSFYSTKQLNTLKITNSQLKRIEVGTFTGRNLSTLMISYSSIEYIAPGAFRGLEALTTLCLNRNKIVYLKKGAFDGLSELLSLDLSSNNLKSVNYEIFEGLRKLKTLNLTQTGNNDVSLEKLRKFMPNLVTIYQS